MDNNYQEQPVVVNRGDLRGRKAGRGTTTVAWIALLLALAALALAWTAFNRTGEDLENRIQQGVTEATQSVESGIESGSDTLDSGVDGVDEDDTDTGTTAQ